MKLVLIQPGEFVMGSPVDESGRDNGERQHPVRITRAFYMGVTEVTQRQWKAVMGGNPSRFIGDDLPVEQISANTAVEFCQRLSAKTGKPFRLPTEAEWEYACRAGSTGSYAGTGRLEEMGWFQGNADGRTHPVAQKKPNDWGLFDMHGNVYEFCLDWYGEYPAGPATDPTGPAKSPGAWRVLRGGAWTTLPQICRSAYRGKTPPDYRYSSYGLRCVMESP
jgi:formylglycine-generating enzyme required for sulfatase activity